MGGKYLILLGTILGLVYYLIGVDFSRTSNDIRIIRNILIYVITHNLITYVPKIYHFL